MKYYSEIFRVSLWRWIEYFDYRCEMFLSKIIEILIYNLSRISFKITFLESNCLEFFLNQPH